MTKNVNKICDYSFHPLRVSRPYFKWNIFANEENIYVADGRNPIHFLPTLEKKSNTHSSYDFINNASFLSHQKRLISKKKKKKKREEKEIACFRWEIRKQKMFLHSIFFHPNRKTRIRKRNYDFSSMKITRYDYR